MKINLNNLSFNYPGKHIFGKINAEFDSEAGQPLVILGPSGSGKTTLLKLLGGLLKPDEGEITYFYNDANDADTGGENKNGEAPRAAFMFQEPRLLPWFTALENVSLPLEREMGKKEARERASHFLSLVSLDGKEGAYPKEISGGEAQRVSMARAFAWSAAALFMDEPFQSLDIPLRVKLMDLALSILGKEDSSKKHFLIAVTHDPREAVYLGGRIIILGKPGEGIVFDRLVAIPHKDRIYGSAASGELERELIEALC